MSSIARTILVVDDNAEFVLNLTSLLAISGYSTLTAKDGAEALSILEGGTFIDAAIVDLDMPGKGGLNVIGTTAKIQKKPIPLVAISGAYSDIYLEVAEYLGAKISLRKPWPGKPLTPILDALSTLVPPPIKKATQHQ